MLNVCLHKLDNNTPVSFVQYYAFVNEVLYDPHKVSFGDMDDLF